MVSVLPTAYSYTTSWDSTWSLKRVTDGGKQPLVRGLAFVEVVRCVGDASNFDHYGFPRDIDLRHRGFQSFEAATRRAHTDLDPFVPLVNAGHENAGITPGCLHHRREPCRQVFHPVFELRRSQMCSR